MKRSLYRLILAAGTIMAAGCASLEEIQRKADAGDREMQYNMANRYKEGNGVSPDKTKADEYLKKSFENGYIPAACEIANEIHEKNKLDEFEQLMKCYEVIFGTSPLDISSILAQQKFSYAFPKRSQTYFFRLVEEKKETEALKYKKCILKYLTSEYCPTTTNIEVYRQALTQNSSENENPMNSAQNLDGRPSGEQISGDGNKALAEEKQIIEEKLNESDQDLTPKIKLYKHITSGVALHQFIEESLQKKGEINYCWHSNYCIAFKSSVYPDLVFIFSSSTREPAFSHFELIRNKSDYEYMSRYLDIKGKLLEIEISLPKTIDKEKVFSKLCKDYPQIKPIFEKKDVEKPVGDCVLKTTGGVYVWSNDEIYVSFTYADYAGVTGSIPYIVENLKKEGQNFGVRKILLQDRKLFKLLVADKKDDDKKAQETAQEAMLDF